MSTESVNTKRRSTSLSAADIHFYRSEGFLILRGVFQPSEMEALANDADRVREEHADIVHVDNMRVRFQQHCDTEQPVFEVFDPIADLSPVASSITVDERIVGPLHDLYGEPAEVFKDKFIYKPAGASGASLHQDWIAWSGFPESFLTVIVAIDPFTPENGATVVFPRLHQNGSLAPRDGAFYMLEKAALTTEPVPLLLEAGDIAIFSGFTPHYSEPNIDTRNRRGYFISYNATSDGGNQYEAHYREYHDWIRAKSPEPKRSRLFFR